jgi:enoyl-CoA hydratase/carnithine racemase
VEALGRGLVDELASDGGATAGARLEALAAHPRETYRLTKLALREAPARATREDEERFLGPELDRWCSDEIRARIARVLSK